MPFAIHVPIEVREEPQNNMCVTKKTNRRPQTIAAAATFLGTPSSPVAPSSTTCSSRFASASPMISPIHLPPKAEPSTSSANINATTATYSTSTTSAASGHDSSCRERQRMSTVVPPPTSPNRSKKFVTFSAVTVVKTTVVPSSTMTDERKDELWYSRDALENFKKAARRDSKAHRTSSDDEYSSSFSSSDDDTNGLSSPGSQRGLEQHRTSLLLQRQRNKYAAHRAILECTRRLASSPSSSPPNCPTSTIPIDADDHLALVSSKVTRWSREVALSTGRNNFYCSRCVYLEYR